MKKLNTNSLFLNLVLCTTISALSSPISFSLIFSVSPLSQTQASSASTKKQKVENKSIKNSEKKKKKVNKKAFQLVTMAVKAASEEDYHAAIAYLERALMIEPNYPDALFNIGSIYRVQQRHSDAYVVFQQLLNINPYDHEARLEKTLALIGLKSYQKATAELDAIPKNTPRYGLVEEKLKKAKLNALRNPKQSTKNKLASAQNNGNNSPEHNENSFFQNKSLYNSPKQQSNKSQVAQSQNQGQNKNSQPLNFSSPTGIASDSKSNIYVAYFLTNKVEKIEAGGGKRKVFASGNMIMGPSGLVFDERSNSLLVANYKSGTVVSIDEVGKIKLLVDNLQKPYSIFLDEAGKLYVSEQGKKAVSIINIY